MNMKKETRDQIIKLLNDDKAKYTIVVITSEGQLVKSIVETQNFPTLDLPIARQESSKLIHTLYQEAASAENKGEKPLLTKTENLTKNMLE